MPGLARRRLLNKSPKKSRFGLHTRGSLSIKSEGEWNRVLYNHSVPVATETLDETASKYLKPSKYVTILRSVAPMPQTPAGKGLEASYECNGIRQKESRESDWVSPL